MDGGRVSRAVLLATVSYVAVAVMAPRLALAEVRTDGTLGRRGVVPGGANVAIPADLGQQRGGNLFHSFEKFDVETNGRVTFTGPDGIRNVIGRVTGGEPSSIDGTLASTIPDADLYLLNPAGILFGPNARLDVKGSFHASTADELRLMDGAVFSALDTGGSTLSVAEPQAFGFLGASVGAITVDRSILSIPAGKSLSLAGGDVTITGGHIAADNGRLAIEALAGPGRVGLNTHEIAGTPGGTIGLTDGTVIDVSGDGGGEIRLHAGIVAITNSDLISRNLGSIDSPFSTLIEANQVFIADRGSIKRAAVAGGNTGSIEIRAGILRIIGPSGRYFFFPDDTGLLVYGKNNSLGKEGDIYVRADSAIFGYGGSIANGGGLIDLHIGEIILQQGGQIASGTNSAANAGDIDIFADSLIIQSGGGIFSNSTPTDGINDPGDAGRMNISSSNLVLTDGNGTGEYARAGFFGGGITSLALASNVLYRENLFRSYVGQPSRITIRSDQIGISSTGIRSYTAGTASGDLINVTAGKLYLGHAGTIGTQALYGSMGGQAGSIAVDVGSLVLDGGLLTSQVGAGADVGNARAGDITVAAGDVRVLNDGSIKTGSGFVGGAGSVQISAGYVRLGSGGSIATNYSTAAGSINVSADVMIIDGRSKYGPSKIDAGGNIGNSFVEKNGGITINVNDLIISNGGIISSDTAGSRIAGGIELRVDNLSIFGGEADFTGVSSASLNGTGDGGRIDIHANRIDLQDAGVIRSESFGAGRAGIIEINTSVFDATDSAIRTVGKGSAGGNINLAATNRIYLRKTELSSSGIEPANASSIITLAARQIVLNGSTVTSLTGAGQPLAGSGEATLLGDVTVISADSLVAGSSSIVVSGLQTNLGSDLQISPNVFLDADSLLQPGCAERGPARSTFSRGGRGGLPPAPDRPLPSAGAEPPAAVRATDARPIFLDLCAGSLVPATKS